ncbi:MAG: hypothetical protein F9K16_01380 [Thermoanaerobaculia bacterium]|nr:MAG: hypothetical protein F9K16_01380 [Thermoanaerobaculia bacterium]MBZ0102150.1 hypothetical protein [Thermoanaerobaculia bacterium]
MPDTEAVRVKDLALDLANFRTVRQADEKAALEAMISTSPDRFWALTESLLQDGYLPTESIIVLRDGQGRALTVKEGNRRVAALKLIHRLLRIDAHTVPENIATQIAGVTKAWRRDNEKVPCTIYDEADAKTVDRIVRLAHGKGEKAGRDQWNAVARARHNRDANDSSEPALDLLEAYLEHGRNVTSHQRARWAGAFPLSVLGEAMKRIAPRLGASSAPALAVKYPDVKHRNSLEAIIHAIGLEQLGFEGIRSKDVDFGESYGLPAAKPAKARGADEATGSRNAQTRAKGQAAESSRQPQTRQQQSKAQRALATGDPRAVRQLLKGFAPRGKGREKLTALRDEIVLLDVHKTPLAFCFVLRSMFEISAKAYCDDHAKAGGPSATKSSGEERHLVEILRDITKHATSNNSDRAKKKALHGAMTELGKAQGILSVTSMNQLVHNPRFSVAPSDVAVTFGNVFPLLEEMNA